MLNVHVNGKSNYRYYFFHHLTSGRVFRVFAEVLPQCRWNLYCPSRCIFFQFFFPFQRKEKVKSDDEWNFFVIRWIEVNRRRQAKLPPSLSLSAQVVISWCSMKFEVLYIAIATWVQLRFSPSIALEFELKARKNVLIMQAREAKCYDNFYIKIIFFFATNYHRRWQKYEHR